MNNPGRNRRLKRKRVEQKTYDVTLKEDERQVSQTLAAATLERGEGSLGIGQIDTPLVRFSHNMGSKAVFVLDNASLQKSLVRKENGESAGNEEHNDGAVEELPGIQPALHSQSSEGGVYFILERASLCVANVGKKYQILNPDDHASFLRKQNKNPYDYRPDIVHEALLQIMSSRLRMAGRLRAVFIRTDQGVLIKVSAHASIPETLAGFCHMVELLQKFRIKAKSNRATLLRVIKNPVTRHLPINSHKIGLSFSSSKTARLSDYISNATHHTNLVFVVGAMAHGKIEADYADDLISVSGLPLSAGTCLKRICIALEKNWKIL